MSQENVAVEETEGVSTPQESPEQGEKEAKAEQAEKAPKEESATSDETQEEAKRKSGIQKRFDELTRQRYEALQRAEDAERREQAMRQQAFQQSYEATKPTLEQYGHDTEAWSRAYEQWLQVGQQKAYEAQQQAAYKQAEMQSQMLRQQAIQEKAARAQTKYPDFAQKVFDPSLPSLAELSPAAFDAVVDSDVMGDIAYYLATNPEEVYKLGQLSPIQAIKEVARLEAKLTSKPATVHNPPPPPPPDVSTRHEANMNPDKMSIEEFMAWRNEKTKR